MAHAGREGRGSETSGTSAFPSSTWERAEEGYTRGLMAGWVNCEGALSLAVRSLAGFQ